MAKVQIKAAKKHEVEEKRRDAHHTNSRLGIKTLGHCVTLP